jgi:hypothetical protein
MNRSRIGTWARRIVWATLLGVAALGCSPLQVAGFIFGRDQVVPAPSPLTFGKDNAKKAKDKEEVVVLLLPHLAPGTMPTFYSADRDLATELAHILPEMAKENKDKKKVHVLSPTQVDKFKTANPGWKTMNPVDIGQKLGADFVLDIELAKMQLYQPHTAQERIYEGKADVTVTVYEVGSEGGVKDSYAWTFSHPKGMIRDAAAIGESQMKKEYITNLAVEIAQHHVDHKPTDGIDGH